MTLRLAPAESNITSPSSALFQPILAPLMADRKMTYTIVGVATIHLALTVADLPAWQCPIRAATGVPCPGCGLSRACSALLRGQFDEAMSLHIFAPFFILTFLLMAVVSLLPSRQHHQMVQLISRFERKTGLIAFSLIGLMLYWLVRLTWLGFGPV